MDFLNTHSKHLKQFRSESELNSFSKEVHLKNKIEEKQQTYVVCILRGYFLFHVVTMLNNNSFNFTKQKDSVITYLWKVLSEMLRNENSVLCWEDGGWRRRRIIFIKFFIYNVTSLCVTYSQLNFPTTSSYIIWIWICFPSSQSEWKTELKNWLLVLVMKK